MKNALTRCALLLLTLAGLVLAPFQARAQDEVVVIVNRDNPHAIDRATLVAIYTGRVKGWADGSPVFPLDQPQSNALRETFYTQVIGRSVANIQAIWAQNIFAGKGLPPKVATPDGQMKHLVATNRNAIGYIRASEIDDTVRVVWP